MVPQHHLTEFAYSWTRGPLGRQSREAHLFICDSELFTQETSVSSAASRDRVASGWRAGTDRFRLCFQLISPASHHDDETTRESSS